MYNGTMTVAEGVVVVTGGSEDVVLVEVVVVDVDQLVVDVLVLELPEVEEDVEVDVVVCLLVEVLIVEVLLEVFFDVEVVGFFVVVENFEVEVLFFVVEVILVVLVFDVDFLEVVAADTAKINHARLINLKTSILKSRSPEEILVTRSNA